MHLGKITPVKIMRESSSESPNTSLTSLTGGNSITGIHGSKRRSDSIHDILNDSSIRHEDMMNPNLYLYDSDDDDEGDDEDINSTETFTDGFSTYSEATLLTNSTSSKSKTRPISRRLKSKATSLPAHKRLSVWYEICYC